MLGWRMDLKGRGGKRNTQKSFGEIHKKLNNDQMESRVWGRVSDTLIIFLFVFVPRIWLCTLSFYSKEIYEREREYLIQFL